MYTIEAFSDKEDSLIESKVERTKSQADAAFNRMVKHAGKKLNINKGDFFNVQIECHQKGIVKKTKVEFKGV